MMAPLMNTDQQRSDWLTVEAAAKRLGVSPATIKRRIQDSKPVRLAGDRSVELESELIERPQGHEWRVRIKGALLPISSAPERSDSEDASALSSVQEDSGALTALLDMVVDIRALERENGTLRAERDAERMRADSLQAERDRLSAELERERRRSVWKPWTW